MKPLDKLGPAYTIMVKIGHKVTTRNFGRPRTVENPYLRIMVYALVEAGCRLR